MNEENEQSEHERYLSHLSALQERFNFDSNDLRNARLHAQPPVVRYHMEYEVSEPFKKLVATRYDRFKVLEYTEIDDVHVTPVYWKITTWYDEQGRLMGKKERVNEPRD